jgi:O-acetyl-ADP-ribose deacetylase (regulator of RNase III)
MPGKASLHNVNHPLKALARLIAEEMLTNSLALPRLATGVGGLDCAKVRPLIEKHLETLEIFVIIYTAYRNGLRFDERDHDERFASVQGLSIARTGSGRLAHHGA